MNKGYKSKKGKKSSKKKSSKHSYKYWYATDDDGWRARKLRKIPREAQVEDKQRDLQSLLVGGDDYYGFVNAYDDVVEGYYPTTTDDGYYGYYGPAQDDVTGPYYENGGPNPTDYYGYGNGGGPGPNPTDYYGYGNGGPNPTDYYDYYGYEQEPNVGGYYYVDVPICPDPPKKFVSTRHQIYRTFGWNSLPQLYFYFSGWQG